jgi:hypothetical protein
MRDAYIENNKMKRQAWLILPVALIIIGVIVLFGDRDEENLPQAKIINSSPQSMLLELPVITSVETPDESAIQNLNWQAQEVSPPEKARQQVLQSLKEFSADFKLLRPQLEIWAKPGSTTNQKLARRMGQVLAQNNLGSVNQNLSPPDAAKMIDRGVLLVTAKDNILLAKRLIAAFNPYLSGRVRVLYDHQITPQSMQLYFFGSPYFSDVGQATFDNQF